MRKIKPKLLQTGFFFNTVHAHTHTHTQTAMSWLLKIFFEHLNSHGNFPQAFYKHAALQIRQTLPTHTQICQSGSV